MAINKRNDLQRARKLARRAARRAPTEPDRIGRTAAEQRVRINHSNQQRTSEQKKLSKNKRIMHKKLIASKGVVGGRLIHLNNQISRLSSIIAEGEAEAA